MKKNSGKSSIIEGLLMFAFVNTIFGFIYIGIIFVYLNKMKIVYFLFASVLLLINCRDKCEGVASSKSDCTDYQLKDDEKDDGDSCCFVKTKTDAGEVSVCAIFVKSKVVDEVKEAKKEEGVKSVSIECSSNWLSITLLFVIFALCF